MMKMTNVISVITATIRIAQKSRRTMNPNT
jgi:hypothetical protein